MRHLTVRGLPSNLAQALQKEARDREQSLNQTIKDLLVKALGLNDEGAYDNGLGRFAGSWSREELRAFEKRVARFEQIDEEQWR